MSSLAVNSGGGGGDGQTVSGSGSTLKPYLRRKKSSLGETKVAVLGMSGVGKSALAVRFLTKRFIGEYDQSAENKYKCTTLIEGESIAFELLDTRSTVSPQTQKEDHGAREDVVRWADGFMLVYSVTSRASFQVLPDLRRKVEEAKQPRGGGGGGGGGGGSGSHAQHVPVIVVANKADLAHYREVTQDEGARLAVELGCSFMEVSASEDMPRVMEAFHTLCREIIDYKRRSRTFLDRVFGLKKS